MLLVRISRMPRDLVFTGLVLITRQNTQDIIEFREYIMMLGSFAHESHDALQSLPHTKWAACSMSDY